MHIRPYGEVLKIFAGGVLKTSVGDNSWRCSRTIWGRSQDDIFQRPDEVGRGRWLRR